MEIAIFHILEVCEGTSCPHTFQEEVKAPMGKRCATSTHSQQEDLNLGHLTAGRAVQTLARHLLFSVPWLPAPSPLQGCLLWGTFQRTVLLPDPRLLSLLSQAWHYYKEFTTSPSA